MKWCGYLCVGDGVIFTCVGNCVVTYVYEMAWFANV